MFSEYVMSLMQYISSMSPQKLKICFLCFFYIVNLAFGSVQYEHRLVPNLHLPFLLRDASLT